jgi:hypothetical protein
LEEEKSRLQSWLGAGHFSVKTMGHFSVQINSHRKQSTDFAHEWLIGRHADLSLNPGKFQLWLAQRWGALQGFGDVKHDLAGIGGITPAQTLLPKGSKSDKMAA